MSQDGFVTTVGLQADISLAHANSSTVSNVCSEIHRPMYLQSADD